MNETVKSWLEGLITKEVDEVLDHIKNSEIWCSKISDKETLQMQLESLSLYNEYLTSLKTLKNRIEREDL